MRVLDLSVPPPGTGERLDRFLAAAQTDLSRSRLQGLIEAGRVRVNGRPVRASQRLREGDRVRVEIPEPEPAILDAEDLPLAIVHEDPDLVVIDKPAGLVVHPGAGQRRGTLAHALLHRYPEIAGVGGAGRPGIVHRLDKDTSGLLVVARSARAFRTLVEALRARAVKRTYQALVWGEPRAASGVIEASLGRHPKDRQRMAVVVRGGKDARTRWRIAERFPRHPGVASRLEVELDTGRTHQIRVHMAHLGHPVVGDPDYGGRGKKLLSVREPQRSLAGELLKCLPRQALHASALELPHPVTGTRLAFESPLPEDIERALGLLRARARGSE
jgi:23S rRNA pseudouridine1911/1915/1917 synthase